jgi:hypothetical protein
VTTTAINSSSRRSERFRTTVRRSRNIENPRTACNKPPEQRVVRSWKSPSPCNNNVQAWIDRPSEPKARSNLELNRAPKAKNRIHQQSSGPEKTTVFQESIDKVLARIQPKNVVFFQALNYQGFYRTRRFGFWFGSLPNQEDPRA